MTDLTRNILRVACRQLVTLIADRTSTGEVEPITLDSRLVRDFIQVFNDEVYRAQRERDAMKDGYDFIEVKR